MKKNLKNGFTLVELLAVIVILAIILVIAVPKVMSVIEDAKKATLESTAKMIASQAEKQKVQNTVLGNDGAITCEDIANINDVDYEDCDIAFDNNTAKVTITGAGKFEGLFVCNGTKTSATTQKESCPSLFEIDDWATIISNVQSGTHPYEVGNTKTVDMGSLGVHTIRVANTTKCSEVEVASETACGFVLEFADIIRTHTMNGTDSASSTNVGGWPATEMRTYLNDLDTESDDDGVIYNALPESLRAGIINTYVVSSHGSGDTTGELENDNFGSTDKLYLLSPQEVYGTSFTNQYDSSNGTSRQLDYYANYKGVDSSGAEYTGVSTTNEVGAIKNNSSGSASAWWLRSASSRNSISFYNVTTSGDWIYNFSYYSSYGVAPAFRLAE